MPRRDRSAFTRGFRDEMIAAAGGKCVACDATTGLQFHHRDPSQKAFKVSQAIASNWSRERILTEAAKCELRCHRHHIEVHATEIPHGSGAGYWRGCRCDDCVAAFRLYGRERKRLWRENAGRH